MSGDNIQSQIEFILEHQAKFSADVDRLTEEISGLKDVQKQQGQNVDKLTRSVERVINEMHDGFNNLIVANEVTRNLAERATKLAIQNSKRITKLEKKRNGNGK